MDENHLKTVLDAGARVTSLQIPTDPLSVLVVPDGYKPQSTEALIGGWRERPLRVKASVKMEHLDSFIEYVKLFAIAGQTRIFADSKGGMVAIVDYHTAPSGGVENGPPAHSAVPAWAEHRATYSPIVTPEWTRWMVKNKQRMDQAGFAEFLEENQEMVIDPKGADLLEMIQTLEGKNHIDCNSLIRLSNGKTKLDYSEEVSLKGQVNNVPGSVDFPNLLTAGIVPFDGGAAYKVSCRLRYRIESRKLTFWYEIIDPHLVIKTAIQEITAAVTEKTGIAPLFGTP